MEYKITVFNSNLKLVEKQNVLIIPENNKAQKKQTDSSGMIELEDLIPNNYFLQLEESDISIQNDINENEEKNFLMTVKDEDYTTIYLLPESKNVLIQLKNSGNLSS